MECCVGVADRRTGKFGYPKLPPRSGGSPADRAWPLLFYIKNGVAAVHL